MKDFSLKVWNIVYIAIVAAILIFPTILVKLRPGLHVDNRVAAEFPALSIDNISDFPRQFESWFNDRIGGRDVFLAMGNYLIFQIFHESPGKQVLVGRDGFLFLASHHDGKDNFNSLIWSYFKFDQDRVKESANDFISLLSELEKSPIHVLFFSVPTKHLLYFDKMPSFIADEIPDSRRVWTTEVINEIIRLRPDAARFLVDIRPEAERVSSNVQLIPPGNFHWVPGPYTHLAANIIARKFGVASEIYVPKSDDYRLIKDKYSDLKQFIYPWLRTPALMTLNDDFSRMGIVTAASNAVEVCTFNPSAKGGRILLIGDSFTLPLGQDMARYFREVISIEHTEVERREGKSIAEKAMRQLIAAWNPEYIVVISHFDACAWGRTVAAMLAERE